MEEERLAANEVLAEAYFKLLLAIDWSDGVLVQGLREGLNKFISNAHLSSTRGIKYHKTHFISRSALQQLEDGTKGGLIFEHLVPKTRYIQEPCESLARRGDLSLEHVRDRLRRYWYLATITVQEDLKLSRSSMPPDWDGMDILARYRSAGLDLIPNPYFGAAASLPG